MTSKEAVVAWMQWYMSLIPALGRKRPVDLCSEFPVSKVKQNKKGFLTTEKYERAASVGQEI